MDNEAIVVNQKNSFNRSFFTVKFFANTEDLSEDEVTELEQYLTSIDNTQICFAAQLKQVSENKSCIAPLETIIKAIEKEILFDVEVIFHSANGITLGTLKYIDVKFTAHDFFERPFIVPVIKGLEFDSEILAYHEFGSRTWNDKIITTL